MALKRNNSTIFFRTVMAPEEVLIGYHRYISIVCQCVP